MYKLISFVLIFISLNLNAQYKNDNVLYKTVYPEDLRQELKENPGYLLLDVRSKEENRDEDSSMMGLNIGHLKNAKNIDVRELGKRLNELQNYKNTPVFVYCSHSQRSRRASKMLADSGFTKVFNINGGMTTLLQTNSNIADIYETKNKFQYLSPAQFCNEINNKDVLVIDIREDSSYNAATIDETVNSMGKFKNAKHIPASKLKSALFQLPKNKKIIIINEFEGSEKAANILTENGYKNVAVLFDGIENFIAVSGAECKHEVWKANRKYNLLAFDEFNALAKKDPLIIDIRPTEEFKNQAKNNFRNTGHIKNAVNIPSLELNNRLSEISSYKNKPVIIYNLGGYTDAYNAAAMLVSKGFTNVNVLTIGIFGLRWRAANIKGKGYLKDWVIDIPADNL